MNPRHTPRQRPPWWPADQPWPPESFAGHAERRALFRQFGCVFLLFAFFAVAGALSLAWFVMTLLGAALPIDLPRPWAIVVVIALIFGLVTILRTARRMATPLGDIVEAVGRVGDGDYTVRIDARRPRSFNRLARSFNAMAERLQHNDEQRRALMADIAHELRTPLAVIQGQVEGMLDGLYPRDDAHLAPLLDETRFLTRLIEDLRTLSLAETGTLPLQKEPVDVAVLAADVAASFHAQAEANGITLAAEFAGGAPAVAADPTRIREVLSNLIANALRYTPHGGTITVRGGTTRDTNMVTIEVTDTGSGIASDDLPHIFDRFTKSRDSGGSGLGLAIAKNLVAAHGGEIRAESAPGQGTTITFSLPVA
ncbi:MAG: HAMP domain-containing protein [Chloroflexi bacterium]|nr:HAMP domain-containing protein [Chloroflexota bacterium]